MSNNNLKSWVSVYRIFCAINDTVLELPEGIDHNMAHEIVTNLVDSLYISHLGELAWDMAYYRWTDVDVDVDVDNGEV